MPRNRTERLRRTKLRQRTMSFGTWNVQGMSGKINEVITEIANLHIDIAVVTETKKKGQGSENLGEYDHFYSGVPKTSRAKQGVSILIRKKLRRYITTYEAINERIIKMNLCLHGHKLTIIGVYAVNDDALVNSKDEFYEQLHGEVSRIGKSREIILLGDLNSRVGKKYHNNIVGQFGEDTVNDNGNRLVTVCEQNELRILNGFFQHREIHKYTWTQNTRNLKSIIDYVLIRQKSNLKPQDVKVCRGASCGSDHYLLRAKIAFPNRREKERIQPDTENPATQENIDERKYNLNCLEHESIKCLYKNRLDEKLENTNFNSIEDHYKYIKECIHAAGYEALGLYQRCEKQRRPYWWDEDIQRQIEDKRQKYSKFLSTMTNDDKIIYKEAQAKVRRMICRKKNEAWERNCTRINTFMGGKKSTESWKLITSIRKDNRRDIISSISPEKWDDHFKKLLTENRPQFEGVEDETQSNINTISSPIRITLNEVKQVCTNSKNGKAAGPGGIPTELIKYGTNNLYEHLRKLFEQCANGGEIPEEWKTSYISTIHKKGSRESCDNYRGIAVTSSISRIYGKILKNKIENEYRDMEAEEQAGFRAGRSTLDHLFCVTQLIEKKLAINQEVHLLYVDLQKAYDSIPLNKLWESLNKTNIQVNLIKAVKKLYENSRAKVKIGNKITKGFNVNKGLKQGCCLSPTLFKIYLEQALKTWKRKCKNMGIPLNDDILYTLCFADDQIVLAQDYDDIQYMTRKLIEEYTKWGLEVNMKKTEYMCINGQAQNLILEDGQHIGWCDEYKYLGMKITRDGTLDAAIKDRNTQGRKAITLMNGILWDKHISKNNKKLIYDTILKSIVTYGSEVWQLKDRSTKTLNATEMDFWRRAAGKSKRERVTNERIREIMGISHTLVDDIRTKQLRWYGHVQRMDTERLPKQILTWRPPGKRKRGRPRRSWREGIDNEMRGRGIEEDLWNDRDQWRLGIERRRRTL